MHFRSGYGVFCLVLDCLFLLFFFWGGGGGVWSNGQDSCFARLREGSDTRQAALTAH